MTLYQFLKSASKNWDDQQNTKIYQFRRGGNWGVYEKSRQILFDKVGEENVLSFYAPAGNKYSEGAWLGYVFFSELSEEAVKGILSHFPKGWEMFLLKKEELCKINFKISYTSGYIHPQRIGED